MKHLLVILFCAIGISAYAVGYTPTPSGMPAAEMQSVNNHAYMSSGSSYAPTVYAVGASTPTRTTGPRKSPPGKDEGGYDPNNPQFAPIGDELVPLLLMVMAYATSIFLKRKKMRARS